MQFALAQQLQPSYVVDGFVYDLYDGDTVYYHASLGYYQWAAFQTGRLLHIDTPEIHKAASKAAGIAAKQHLQGLITKYAINRESHANAKLGSLLKLVSYPASSKTDFDPRAVASREKFGRWLVELIGADEQGNPINLNKRMVEDGYAVIYEGGTKGKTVTTAVPWACAATLPLVPPPRSQRIRGLRSGL